MLRLSHKDFWDIQERIVASTAIINEADQQLSKAQRQLAHTRDPEQEKGLPNFLARHHAGDPCIRAVTQTLVCDIL